MTACNKSFGPKTNYVISMRLVDRGDFMAPRSGGVINDTHNSAKPL